MREILFRGKRADNGEWVEGQLLYFKSSVGTNELALIVEGCEWDNSTEWFNLGKRAKVIPETVGQFTGLLDKNSKKIFEGDIVRCEIEYDVGCYPHTETYTGTVMYEGGMFHPLCVHCDTKKVEVLGNSWDDPEEMEELNP